MIGFEFIIVEAGKRHGGHYSIFVYVKKNFPQRARGSREEEKL